MNFYSIRLKHVGNSKYVWASGYGPMADSIDDMVFLRSAPDAFKSMQAKFWEINRMPPGVSLDPGGHEWPDFLGCGMGMPSFFVSQRVSNDLQEAGIPCLRASNIPVVHPEFEMHCAGPQPEYCVMEAVPGIEMAWSAMGISCDLDNRVDFSRAYPSPWPPEAWKVSVSSWSGLDLVSYENWQTPMTLVCTEEVKRLAKKKKWTNVLFIPLVSVE